MLRLLAMDPGSKMAGITILEVGETLHVPFVETVNLERQKCRYQDIAFSDGDLASRCHALRDHIAAICRHYEPHAFVYETQYVNASGNVSSFEATNRAIEFAIAGVKSFKAFLPVQVVSPSAVKCAMGVPGNSGDKELMRKALLSRAISYAPHLAPERLDEHAIDSVCIAITSLPFFYRVVT